MERVFKHRKTGEIAYYKDGILKSGNCCIEIGVEPSRDVWAEALFTTEDGVPIFLADEFFCAVKIGNKYRNEIVSRSAYKDNHKNYSKIFSSFFEAAKFVYEYNNRKPLLVTQEGVELFEGDDYWFFWTKNPAHRQEVNTIYKYKVKPLDSETTWSKNAVFFSSEIAAKNYVKENEKKYSLNDIKEAVKNLNCFGTTLIEYLENEANK